jgi:plastocyanin domain-containing protein
LISSEREADAAQLKEGTMKRLAWIVLFIMLAAVVFAAEPQKKVFTATVENGIQKVNMLAGSYFFDPTYVIVKANIPVELTIKKEPGAPHDFVIDSPDAGMSIKEALSTEPKLIKFTPTKPGKYPFYCDKKFLFFPSHRSKGMEGTIEVTP